MPHKNKEDASASQKRWRHRNKEKVREYQKANAWRYKAHNKRKYAEKKAILIEHLGGCCEKCGTTENLEFDHRNPSDQTFNKTPYLLSEENMWKEAEVLRLLCRDCHKEHSAAQIKAAWQLFIDLPLEEQERLLLKYIRD